MRAAVYRLILARSLARIARRRHRPWVVSVALLIDVKQRIAPLLWLRLPLAVGRFTVSHVADLGAISEVLEGQEYAIEGVEPLTIVDAGSHVGASIVFFHDRYPDASIIGVEPDPDSFAKLTANTRLIPGLELHNCAVADRSGEAPFYQSAWNWESTLIPQHGRRSSTRVPVRTLDEIVDGRTVDLLKVDIEGAEYSALRAFRGLSTVRALAVEYHADTCPATFAEFLSLFEGFSIQRITGDSADRAVIVAMGDGSLPPQQQAETGEAIAHAQHRPGENGNDHADTE